MDGLKNTKQRAAILSLLNASAEPISADELFETLKADFPALAISTVYRNLERFTALGIAEKEAFPDGVQRFSPAEKHSHYLICTVCNKKIKLGVCPLAGLERRLEHDTGFEIDGHSLVIYGKCPNCR